MYTRFIYASEYKPVLTFAWLVIIMVVIVYSKHRFWTITNILALLYCLIPSKYFS